MVGFFKKIVRFVSFRSINIFGPFMSDERFLKIRYRMVFDRKLNLANPQTFTEKLQWLKLFDRKAIYSVMVDKYAVKAYVKNIVGEKFIIPTLGVWDNVEDIEWGRLPDKFVLKTSNGGGGNGVVICKDKSKANLVSIKEKLNAAQKIDLFRRTREWPYKNVRSRILAEPYIEDEKTHDLKDYKFFCFNGKVRFYKIDINRFVCHRANYYTPEGERLPFEEVGSPSDADIKVDIPERIVEMIQVAEKLSCGIPFLRVDLYYANGEILFGELTFFPSGGFTKIVPKNWDFEIGNYLRLPSLDK